MKKAILLATLAIVAIAGCTVPNVSNIFPVTNTVIGGTGMVMTSYAADQSEVYSSQTDRIMMTVSNAGGHLVPYTEALVYLTGSALNPSCTDTKTCWTGASTQIQYFTPKDMKPADPIRDIPADEKTFTWSYTSPNISRGEQNSYLFIGRVYYDYQTKVTGNIWVYTQDEADAQRAAGKSLQTSTWSATAGPVAVVAKATQDPVVLYGTENTITLVIKVSNAGGGVLYQKGSITDYDSAAESNLKLTADELNRVSISGSVGGTDLPPSCSGPQELVGGKPLTLTCDVALSTTPTTFQGYPITITADYGYYTEQSTSVTVSGR